MEAADTAPLGQLAEVQLHPSVYRLNPPRSTAGYHYLPSDARLSTRCGACSIILHPSFHRSHFEGAAPRKLRSSSPMNSNLMTRTKYPSEGCFLSRLGGMSYCFSPGRDRQVASERERVHIHLQPRVLALSRSALAPATENLGITGYS